MSENKLHGFLNELQLEETRRDDDIILDQYIVFVSVPHPSNENQRWTVLRYSFINDTYIEIRTEP